MKVGDIGILQNIIYSPWLNGCVAEIIGGLEMRSTLLPDGVWIEALWGGRYVGQVCKHEICPLFDPDKESIPEEESLTA